MLPGFVVTMVAGLAAARLGRVFPLRALVPTGLGLAAIGFLLCTLLGGPTSVGLLVVASVLIGGGIGLSETITNDAILSAAPPERAGSASAVSETAYEIGAVLGTAVLGGVLTAVYRAVVQVPFGASPADAHAAAETLGGAVATAARLPGAEGFALLESARAAFVTAIDVTALVGAGTLVAVALIVLLGLRNRVC